MPRGSQASEGVIRPVLYAYLILWVVRYRSQGFGAGQLNAPPVVTRENTLVVLQFVDMIGP